MLGHQEPKETTIISHFVVSTTRILSRTYFLCFYFCKTISGINFFFHCLNLLKQSRDNLNELFVHFHIYPLNEPSTITCSRKGNPLLYRQIHIDNSMSDKLYLFTSSSPPPQVVNLLEGFLSTKRS